MVDLKVHYFFGSPAPRYKRKYVRVRTSKIFDKKFSRKFMFPPNVFKKNISFQYLHAPFHWNCIWTTSCYHIFCWRFVNNDVLTNIFPHLYILSKLQKGSLVYTYLELVIILRLMQKRSPTTNSSIWKKSVII